MLQAFSRRVTPTKLDRFRILRRREERASGEASEGHSPAEKSLGWFSKMHLSSSSKRARSPALGSDNPNASKLHNTIIGERARKEPSAPQPQMPSFLKQSQSQIAKKFQDLVWRERERLQEGIVNSSPDSLWTRYEGHPTKPLDRYSNIYPWKHNRIRLKVPAEKNDYINASPISVKSLTTDFTTRYIAMQGPKKGSTNHVWRMVWYELATPAVIVMLTETHEAGLEKCFQYFPRDLDASIRINEEDEFGDGFRATVRCVEVTYAEGQATEIRKLIMHVDGQDEEKVIWHLLYTEWPDFGVPAAEALNGFFDLMRLSQEKNAKPENPRIIHCSAGVGRSGTFITLEYLMSELEAGAFVSADTGDSADEDPVFNTVDTLRKQRLSMVQAESQYSFIYQVLRRCWEQKYGVTPATTPPPLPDERASKVARLGGVEDVFN